jgi:hypothetical protein
MSGEELCSILLPLAKAVCRLAGAPLWQVVSSHMQATPFFLQILGLRMFPVGLAWLGTGVPLPAVTGQATTPT